MDGINGVPTANTMLGEHGVTFCNFVNLNPGHMIVGQSVITDIKAIVLNAKERAIRSVDHERTGGFTNGIVCGEKIIYLWYMLF